MPVLTAVNVLFAAWMWQHMPEPAPSKYVATREGEVYSKLLELEHQFEADVVIAIMKAIEVVRKNAL